MLKEVGRLEGEKTYKEWGVVIFNVCMCIYVCIIYLSIIYVIFFEAVFLVLKAGLELDLQLRMTLNL